MVFDPCDRKPYQQNRHYLYILIHIHIQSTHLMMILVKNNNKKAIFSIFPEGVSGDDKVMTYDKKRNSIWERMKNENDEGMETIWIDRYEFRRYGELDRYECTYTHVHKDAHIHTYVWTFRVMHRLINCPSLYSRIQ